VHVHCTLSFIPRPRVSPGGVCLSPDGWDCFLSERQCFSFFAYQRLAKRRCKFEVLFVTFVGGFSDLMKITIAGEVPASFSVGNSDRTVMWSRWAGWLSTCPVLLIHLSNLAGKEVFNARRMMKMLIAFQVLMMCGITASMIETEWKYAFYLGGCATLTPAPLILRYLLTPPVVSLSSPVHERQNGAVTVCCGVERCDRSFPCVQTPSRCPSRSALH
jgi:bacteriorhodopsin